MAVRLRLARIGRHKLPFYKMVAIDGRKARDGMALEILGTYDAIRGKVIVCNSEGIEKWLRCGAQMSDSMKKIYRMAKKQGFTLSSSTPLLEKDEAADHVVEAAPSPKEEKGKKIAAPTSNAEEAVVAKERKEKKRK